MGSLKLFIDAVAFWSPLLPDWPRARAAFRGEAEGLAMPARRPSAALLPPAERRRAPDTVALALEVAAAAVAQSRRSAGELLSVFTSCHGDLAITDAMCTTLVDHPQLVSPTRFHNSVHNAASGYWGIATGCRQASTALSAFEHSFAAGVLEAATQAAAEDRAVLLVGYDTEACGALASTAASRGLLATALVLAPQRGPHSVATLECALGAAPVEPPPLRSAAARALEANAMADALPLLEALARLNPDVSPHTDAAASNAATSQLQLPLSATLALHVKLTEFPG
jgi:hypothetical protein